MRFFTPEILDNPYPLYEQWRAHHPIWQDEETGAWILSRFDDVRHVLKHSSGFSSKAMGGGETGPLPLLTDDAPRHTELRNIVNKAFTIRMLKEIEDEVADIARSLVDGIPEGESVDVVEALTIPLPVAVISKMMGIPSERAQDFKRWSDALTGTLAGASLAEREVEIGEMYAFFQSLIPERRNQDGSDLVSAVVNASVDGKQLSDHDVVGFCMLLLIAGNETTTNLLGNFLNVLADRPQSWQQLRTQPKLIEQGIEETLRFDGPVQFLRRTLTSPCTFHGKALEPGDVVHVIMGSANRDESVYSNAHQFDLGREKIQHHTFGFGIHFCIGAPLARLEAKAAMQALTERFAGVGRGDGDNERVASHLLRGFHHLSLRFEGN
jgi:cytochrome P450